MTVSDEIKFSLLFPLLYSSTWNMVNELVRTFHTLHVFQKCSVYIHILETGKYFNYCQIYFQIRMPNPLPDDDDIETYFLFLVVHESAKTAQSASILMRRVMSNDLVGKSSGYYTLYASGIDVLDEGDVVYVGVQTRQRKFVNSADSCSYFRAFKI